MERPQASFYTYKSPLDDRRRVEDDQGFCVAYFLNNDMGDFAFQCFKAGIAARVESGLSLYDLDRKQFLVGNLNQLSIGERY